MTPEQIREVVKLTVDELALRHMLKTDNYPEVLKIVEEHLRNFFQDKKTENGIAYALRELSDDPYIDIIYLHYRDDCTIENMAEILERGISTIKRNKKRLIKRIFEMMEEMK